ncbi:MAG: MOSC domain-containing protein [Acidimicrobiales bacterium]
MRSVNVGPLVANPAKGNSTAIDKRPVGRPVWVRAPGTAKGRSGLEGDAIGDKKNHGGDDQAVYVFAREDLDRWETVLARSLPDGSFGENLTTAGIDPNQALIGERWQVGGSLLLQVTSPRIPCRTFAAWMALEGWARRFTESGRPGAYLKVLEPGPVCAGDPITVVGRPDHDVDVTTTFLAFTIKPWLLGDLLAAGDDLPDEMRATIETSTSTALLGAPRAVPRYAY